MIFKVLHLTIALFVIQDHTCGLRKHFILDDLKHFSEKHDSLEGPGDLRTASISGDGNNEGDIEKEDYSDENLATQDDKECNSDENPFPHKKKEERSHENADFLREKTDVHEVRRCCSRRSKIIALGFDMAGNEQFLDVGDCSKSCSHQKKHPRHRHHGHRRIVTAEDDMNTSLPLDEISEANEDKTSQNVHHCPSHHHCAATATTVKRHHLVNGPVQVTTIKECDCVLFPTTCARMENIITHYPDTPYERAIDIGRCGGKCGENDLACNPARNKTLFVEGPNGGTCVSVIEECGCSSSCYRMKFYESFYQNVWNYDTNTTEEEILDIDVGKCVGKCDGGLNFHCVLRDSSDPEKCLMSLKKPQDRCIPVEFKIHTFEGSFGDAKNVVAIEHCGCK